ncbi:MAG: PH domain-containing protein [Candidatus Thalassarchaeaceae archaeon]|jgi:putative membrane protein|nr:PH domain-containing protein [Candidatus Thalassarchaeaceae archaeon]MDP6703470.1 PH domain-containing protein [Candidatus Thalassarchaeaceae archaeon]MDP7004363.1 PH domain-containing protein [Candidatus Thalassarchaeaceae archaeon]
MGEHRMLASAQFDRRLIIYWWLMANFMLLVTMVGVLLIPVWVIIGYFVHKKQYENLGMDLTDRSLNVRKGWLFKKQQNIPLDKITDMAVIEGPILSAMGLCHLTIETAGGSGGGGSASLTGVSDALGFRDLVLRQRDGIAHKGVEATSMQTQTSSSENVLVEIRDILRRIEGTSSEE